MSVLDVYKSLTNADLQLFSATMMSYNQHCVPALNFAVHVNQCRYLAGKCYGRHDNVYVLRGLLQRKYIKFW